MRYKVFKGGNVKHIIKLDNPYDIRKMMEQEAKIYGLKIRYRKSGAFDIYVPKTEKKFVRSYDKLQEAKRKISSEMVYQSKSEQQ